MKNILLILFAVVVLSGCSKDEEIKDANNKSTKDSVKGSIVRFIGDSITRATGLNGYVTQIASNTGIVATNKGENGATYGNIYPLASCMSGLPLIYQFDVNTKLCCFFGGTNDFGKNIPIGNNSDGASLINTTTKGSLWKAIQWIKDNYPSCKILVMTPIVRSTDATNGLGLKLIDYRNAIAEICVLQNVECLDLYQNSLITRETACEYLYDGLHPNNLGYDVLTPIIQEAVVRKLVER